MTPFNADLRASLGLSDDHLLILQPTRVIARKGIELAIELVRRLQEPRHRARLLGKEPVLVISHHAGDEGPAYLAKLQTLAGQTGVPLVYAADRFGTQPGVAPYFKNAVHHCICGVSVDEVHEKIEDTGHGGAQFSDAANMQVVLDFLGRTLK